MAPVPAPVDRYPDIPPAARIGETARILDCSEYTVRKLIADGEIRTVRLGRLVRIPRTELVRLLDGHPAA